MPNVDAMLEGMSISQFNEWMAFLNIRARVAKGLTPQGMPASLPAYGQGEEEQKRLSRDIFSAFKAFGERKKRGGGTTH